MLTSLSTEISLFYPQEESTILDLTSLNASSPRVPVFQCCIDLSSSCPSLPAASPSALFILNRKVSLGDTTGDTNVMGATQANAKGVETFSWHHPGGSYFSPRASWTKKGTAFALLVANMPQLQPLSLPQPWTRTDTPIWGLRRGP